MAPLTTRCLEVRARRVEPLWNEGRWVMPLLRVSGNVADSNQEYVFVVEVDTTDTCLLTHCGLLRELCRWVSSHGLLIAHPHILEVFNRLKGHLTHDVTLNLVHEGLDLGLQLGEDLRLKLHRCNEISDRGLYCLLASEEQDNHIINDGLRILIVLVF